MPNLQTDIDFLLLDQSSLIVYAKYINNRASAARGDDLGKITTRAIHYIAELPEFENRWPPKTSQHLEKGERGWNSVITGYMLAPQDKIDQFDADPPKFCHDVRMGEIVVSADDLPYFLYDQSLASKTDPLAGFLRSQFLLRIFKCIFTGPSSANSRGASEKSAGRPPLVVTYNITHVEPRMIAYTAVLARFTLNSQTSWSRRDSDFLAPVFFKRIVDAFKAKKFARETLAWWDMQIFGTTRNANEGTDAAAPPRADSLAARMAAAIAADSAED
ncbi:hypothetical protein C8Q76DRAFT_617430 [Earliella scabrosa]|nr:hypothetical protein C8Q76DRAFT_617430 [Earliella scabrosa]